MKRIITRSDFVALAKELGVRDDWHEPDEQGVEVQVRGMSFDNAGTWPHVKDGHIVPREIVEKYLIIRQHGEDKATVNLTTLCAWASGLEE